MVRKRGSFFLEQALTDRLRFYGAGLADRGRRVSLSGLLEAALWEYLEFRTTPLGVPIPGTDPEPRPHYAGRGRPSAAARATRFTPRLSRTAGRYPSDHRSLARLDVGR